MTDGEYILFHDVEHCGISSIQFRELDHHSIYQVKQSFQSESDKTWQGFDRVVCSFGRTRLKGFRQLTAETRLGNDGTRSVMSRSVILNDDRVPGIGWNWFRGRNWFRNVQHCGIGWLLMETSIWYEKLKKIQRCHNTLTLGTPYLQVMISIGVSISLHQKH